MELHDGTMNSKNVVVSEIIIKAYTTNEKLKFYVDFSISLKVFKTSSVRNKFIA